VLGCRAHLLLYRSQSCHPLCHGLHVPACKQTLSQYQAYCTRQAKEAVCGRCWAAEHTCYFILAGPVIHSATAAFMCLQASNRYQNIKHIVVDRQCMPCWFFCALQGAKKPTWPQSWARKRPDDCTLRDRRLRTLLSELGVEAVGYKRGKISSSTPARLSATATTRFRANNIP
jgi:hypothetical protein